ncbi:diguanylate cyclase, partial [Halopseudomonas phragmitis]
MDVELFEGVAPEAHLDKKFYRAVLDSLEDQLALINVEGQIFFVNRSWINFAQCNGLTYDFDWVGKNYLSVCKAATSCGDDDAVQVVAGLEAVLSGRLKHFRHEYPCHSPGEQRWFILRVLPVQYPGIRCFAVSHQDITQRKLVEQAVEHSAQHDPLTGLANRRRFEGFLARSWRRGQRAVSPLSLLMIDLDNFKPFNDSYGHLDGDRALVRVAAVLQRCARRDTDLAVRYGGDEFVLVLRDTDAEGALRVARGVID